MVNRLLVLAAIQPFQAEPVIAERAKIAIMDEILLLFRGKDEDDE